MHHMYNTYRIILVPFTHVHVYMCCSTYTCTYMYECTSLSLYSLCERYDAISSKVYEDPHSTHDMVQLVQFLTKVHVHVHVCKCTRQLWNGANLH